MQILTVDQIRAWDEFSIRHEPISSIDLMERAATSCFDWLMTNGYKGRSFIIYCGKGNNGGDGLAIARLLSSNGHDVSVRILEFGNLGTEDFQKNLTRLHETSCVINFISTPESIHEVASGVVIIDALFGSGLNKPLTGLSEAIALSVNQSGNEVISIDLPSGLFADRSAEGAIVIKADHTLSFQTYKRAFLMPENARFLGSIHILDIGLHPEYLQTIRIPDHFIDTSYLKTFFKPRDPFAHKGHFGHAALIAGSKGMMGAAVMAGNACLHAGVGKLTCHIPEVGYDIMQVALPEAMCKTNGNNNVSAIDGIEIYDAIAVGPGLGVYAERGDLLNSTFNVYRKPIVVDADGLNAIGDNKSLLKKLPPGSVLTPHPKEFERLFGKCDNDFHRVEIARQKANAFNIVIVIKGHHTVIVNPDGNCFYNTTGNAGLAKGGSGDILTGVLLAFLAQGYESTSAACIAVWLHGRAADLEVESESYESLLPSNIVNSFGKCFRELY